MEVSTKDEVRAIVALGILGTILVYIQLKQTGGSLVPITNVYPATDLVSVITFLINVEMFLSGAYLLLFTLALGIDGFWPKTGFPDFLKLFADAFFGLASLILVGLAGGVWFYLTTELVWTSELSPTTTGYLYNSAAYIAAIFVCSVIAVLWVAWRIVKRADA